MGAYRTRRPFVWQDEMAEVRNLFQKVAQVRDSGFTGFSLWKDEPTAETLSRNRLRRRRSQYGLELTHLNYGESPYDASNHLHNIRGMCSRIQRQNRFVERKKKSSDADLHPALLRRPVTSSYSWSSAKEGSETRASRPGSAPLTGSTPLHYTPSKPTMLYDATHKCPRYKETNRRSSMLSSSATHSNRPGRNALKPMANNHNWETTTVASTGYSSPLTSSSIASSTKTNLKGAPSPDSLHKLDESAMRRREFLELAYAEVETASENENAGTSALYSEVESTEASVFSSSRAPAVSSLERPLSRMMSKRPSSDMTKAVVAEKRGGAVPPRKDFHARSGEPAGHEGTGSIFASSPSLATQGMDGLPTQSVRPPSRKAGEGGRPIEEQRSKTSNPAATKWKSASSPSPSDGSSGLWALRQEQHQSSQQRPTSAGAAMPRAAAAASSEQAHGRPSTSPTRVVVQNSPKQFERVTRFGSSPSANKIAGKNEQLQVRAVQRAFDQELQQVVLSEYGTNEAHHTSTRSEQNSELKPSTVSAAIETGGDSLKYASPASVSTRASEQPANTPVDGDENHVMIKHSTDPYTDFKSSMLRMIDEEDLYDKQRELEELFQYYMDLNPAVHHKVLQTVIADIRKNLGTYKARRSFYEDSP